LFAKLATAADAATRDAALLALASSRNEQGPLKLAGLLPELPAAARAVAMDRLTATQSGARALLASLLSGAVAREALSLAALERMHTLLAGDAAMEKLWRELAGNVRRALRLPGGNDDYVAQPLTLSGPFTVEAWVKLAPEISNHDGILGAPGVLDLNFHAGQFRVWVGGGPHDVVVAKRATTPGVWTHYAVTRDAAGVFRIHLNGELNATGTKRSTNTFAGLHIGRTIPAAGGTDGWLTEFRVWNVARSAEEIRENFDRTFQGEMKPAALTHYFSGANWGELHGAARVEPVDDAPTLLTEAEAKVQAEKFARFRALANTRGNPEHGKELFTTLCLACHQQGGQGGQIAPALDGVANSGVEALLRNILTPNAAMEGGYRKYRVETKDDELLEGLLVSEDATSIVLRQPNVPDQRIPRAAVKRASFLTTSIMPEGLLEGLPPEQVSDLFAYLMTLR
jgi:putative heme-binding domain-containing protein